MLDLDTIRRYRQRMDNLRPGHVWQKQRWKTPEITESFGPDRTTLLPPLVSEKMAIKKRR